MSRVLDDAAIEDALGGLVGWEVAGSGTPADPRTLERVLQFDSFMDGIAFVNLVAEVAEELDHHPDIAVSWTTVGLQISSHDAGGVTERCLQLARRIDDLLEA